MPWTTADSTAAFAAGASAANMAAMRAERAREFAAQEARRAMEERRLAAEAAAYDEHRQIYAQQLAEKAKDEADRTQFSNLVRYDMETGSKTPLESILGRLPALNAANPKLAKEIGGNVKSLIESQQMQAGQAKPLDPSQIAANEARAQASMARAELDKAKTKDVESGGTSSGSIPAWAKGAELIMKAEKDVEAAQEKGDLPALKEASRKLQLYKEGRQMQYRDPRFMAALGIIRSQVLAIDRQLHGDNSFLLKDADKADLLKQREELIQSLKSAQQEGADVEIPGEGASAPSAPASPTAPAGPDTNTVRSIGPFKARIVRP